MSIDFSTPVFPVNVQTVIAARMELIDDSLTVVRRPLRTSDQNLSIGVWATRRTPKAGSQEMSLNLGPSNETIENFEISVQVLAKNATEEDGLVQHSVLTELVTSVLVNDNTLRISLLGLQATVSGITKSLKKYHVTGARYLMGPYNSSNYYLATITLQLDVERLSG